MLLLCACVCVSVCLCVCLSVFRTPPRSLVRSSSNFVYKHLRPQGCHSWKENQRFFYIYWVLSQKRVKVDKGEIISSELDAHVAWSVYWLPIGLHLERSTEEWQVASWSLASCRFSHVARCCWLVREEMGVLCTIAGQGCGLARFYGFRILLCMSFEGTSLFIHAALQLCHYDAMQYYDDAMYIQYIMMQCRVYCLAGAPTSFSGSVKLLMTHAFWLALADSGQWARFISTR